MSLTDRPSAWRRPGRPMWPGGRPSRPGRRRACGRSHDARRGAPRSGTQRAAQSRRSSGPHARGRGRANLGAGEHDGQPGQPPGGDARQLPRCRSRMYLPLTWHIPGRSRCRSAREFTLPGRAPQTPASAVRERGHLNRPRLAWFCREFWLRPGVMIAPGWQADSSRVIGWSGARWRRGGQARRAPRPGRSCGGDGQDLRGWGDRDPARMSAGCACLSVALWQCVAAPPGGSRPLVARQAPGRCGNVPGALRGPGRQGRPAAGEAPGAGPRTSAASERWPTARFPGRPNRRPGFRDGNCEACLRAADHASGTRVPCESAAIPFRQLIRIPIRIPLKGGIP